MLVLCFYRVIATKFLTNETLYNCLNHDRFIIRGKNWEYNIIKRKAFDFYVLIIEAGQSEYSFASSQKSCFQLNFSVIVV